MLVGRRPSAGSRFHDNRPAVHTEPAAQMGMLYFGAKSPHMLQTRPGFDVTTQQRSYKTSRECSCLRRRRLALQIVQNLLRGPSSGALGCNPGRQQTHHRRDRAKSDGGLHRLDKLPLRNGLWRKRGNARHSTSKLPLLNRNTSRGGTTCRPRVTPGVVNADHTNLSSRVAATSVLVWARNVVWQL